MKLFNGDNENTTVQLDDSFDDTNMRFVRRIQESKVREALKRMKMGKAMSPDGIPIKEWRCLGDIAIVWLTKMFNNIFGSNKMPEEWRKSILVPIYKNKGDIQSYTNYRGIKLMSHTMKLWESHRAAPARNDADINKPIWFHAWKVNHRSNLLNKTSYGAIYRAEEGSPHGFH